MNIPNRRECEHHDFGPFTMSISTLPDGNVCEVFFVGRGKIGHEMDTHLRQMGIAISKRIQGDDFTEQEMLTW